MSTEVPRLYREVQLLAALRQQKEKTLATRRQALQELVTDTNVAVEALQQRQCVVAEQRAQLRSAVQAFEQARSERRAHEQTQLTQIATMDEEASSLQRRTETLESDTEATLELVLRARVDASRAVTLEEMINSMQQQLQQSQTEMDQFESKVVRATLSAKSRHDDCAELQLPSVNIAGTGTSNHSSEDHNTSEKMSDDDELEKAVAACTNLDPMLTQKSVILVDFTE